MFTRILSVLSVLIGFMSPASAQVKNTNQADDKNIFFGKNNGNEVLTKDSADFIRVIERDTTDQNLFKVGDFYSDGKPKSLGSSLNPYFDIKKHGTFMEYYHNGHKKSIKTYDEGTATGDEFYYYPNGKLYYISRYIKELFKDSIGEMRDSTGKLLTQQGNGIFIQYDDDFKQILAEGPITNGLKNGEWKGTINDTVSYTCGYEKGTSLSGTRYTKSGKEFHFDKGEIEPHYTGGIEGFYRFLQKTIRYPKLAKDHDIQGKVIISFTVEPDGRLANFKVVKSLGGGCDEETVRVVQASSPWVPGYQYGLPIRVKYTMPMSFTLSVEGQ